MTNQEKLESIFRQATAAGLCKSKKEFAALLGVNDKGLISAMNGNERYLTDSLVSKAVKFANENLAEDEPQSGEPVYVIPYEARGGTIGDFVEGIREYDCEKVISPIRGADFAMEIVGDSMSPEYPSGSRVLIKKVDEEAFIAWGETFVLDTPNGAVIKKVRKTADPDVVECVSVNPAYQPYTIRLDFIRGWYRVLMVMSLK